jgi:hypothetical protein
VRWHCLATKHCICVTRILGVVQRGQGATRINWRVVGATFRGEGDRVRRARVTDIKKGLFDDRCTRCAAPCI